MNPREKELILQIVNALEAHVMRKSSEGAGACMHDDLTTEQFTLLYEAYKELRLLQAQRRMTP
jgi:hypothetical protein